MWRFCDSGAVNVVGDKDLLKPIAPRVVRIKLFTARVSSVCRVSHRVLDWCRK